MFLMFRPNLIKSSLLFLSTACLLLCAPYKVFAQDDSYINHPLKAGDLTLEDVLEAHSAKKPIESQNVLTLPNAPVTAPQQVQQAPPPQTLSQQPTNGSASTSPSGTSEGALLMQGMKSVLQGLTSGASPSAKVGSTVTLSAPKLTTTAPAADLDYVKGQEPKNLDKAATSAPATTTDTTSSGTTTREIISSSPTATSENESALSGSKASSTSPSVAPTSATPLVQVPSASSLEGASDTNVSSGPCSEKVISWTKQCIDAGYPKSFSGEIKGETHTVCPDGTLQDVWVSNTCAPPDEDDSLSKKKASEKSLEEKPVPADTALPKNEGDSASTKGSSDTRVDASCGEANGNAVASEPTKDLCLTGDPTSISGTGPWLWNCKGSSGGMSVSCAAPIAAAEHVSKKQKKSVVTGACGKADGLGTDQAPESDLCLKGKAGDVKGTGPWTWACSGMNGGIAASCKAPKKEDGVCGSVSGMGRTDMPKDNLCKAGYASAVNGDGPWNWTCSGLNGGQAASCSANIKKDAACGDASKISHQIKPSDDLCATGEASFVSGEGPWLWSCKGVDGGNDITCSASLAFKGVCGSADGASVTKAPTENLCLKGKASSVEGRGPWTWECAGSDDTDAQKCSAPLSAKQVGQATASDLEPNAAETKPVETKVLESQATEKTSEAAATAPDKSASEVGTDTSSETAKKVLAETPKSSELCGSAAELAAFEVPTKALCKDGSTPNSVTGEGPWSWTCVDDTGRSSSCSTLSPGSFEAAATALKTNSGTPTETVSSSEVNEKAPGPQADLSASAATAAQAPVADTAKKKQVACGTAADQGVTSIPKTNLCDTGKATRVRGKGPWHWTCVKGKAKVSCEAPLLLDAECGTANGVVLKTTPTKNLCTKGTATSVDGVGPWSWTCAGLGGGVSVSCSAAVPNNDHTEGHCGSSSDAVVDQAPTSNLCSSGIPSAVNGIGPWTWTCSGINGGSASLCSTKKTIAPQPTGPGPELNGLCGAASGAALARKPNDELCVSGTATKVVGNGPWSWNCMGENGGMTVSCTSPLQPPDPIEGACGSAMGVPTLIKPANGLCAAGITSAVSGQGPWTWSCSGVNGGGAVACVAPLAGGTGSMPSLVTPASNDDSSSHASSGNKAIDGGLVTPRLTAEALPKPSRNLTSPPIASEVPPAPPQEGEGITLPSSTPDVPADAHPLTPPPVRDTIKGSPSLQEQPLDSEKALQAVNHYILQDDDDTISFSTGSDVIDDGAAETLDRLVVELKKHPGVRVTLSAYADRSNTTPREARRLSLSRALAVRDYLIARGVSSGRVDVRALGANVSKGDPDRLDIQAN